MTNYVIKMLSNHRLTALSLWTDKTNKQKFTTYNALFFMKWNDHELNEA